VLGDGDLHRRQGVLNLDMAFGMAQKSGAVWFSHIRIAARAIATACAPYCRRRNQLLLAYRDKERSTKAPITKIWKKLRQGVTQR